MKPTRLYVFCAVLFFGIADAVAQQAQGVLNPLDRQLLSAASIGDDRTVQLCLGQGANIEAKNSYGDTPLLEAASGRNTDTLILLLEKGANIEAKNGVGDTALIVAARQGDTDELRLLLQKGANIEATNESGETALMRAASAPDVSALQLLLDKGAQVGARDSCGETPLLQMLGHTLVSNDRKYAAIAAILLNKEANVDAKAELRGQYCRLYGETALMAAAQNELVETAKVLLDKGANADVKDRQGQTALAYAVKTCYLNTVKLLLERGADPATVDNDRETPLRYATVLCKGNPQIIDSLQNAHRSSRQELEEKAAEWSQKLCTIMDTDDCETQLKNIIAVVSEITPPPAIAEEARKNFVEGITLMQQGRAADATQNFRQAIDRAPWWGDAYYNGAIAAENDGQFTLAKTFLRRYLLFPISQAEARDAQDRLYAIGAKEEALKKDQESYLREAAVKYVTGGAQRIDENDAPSAWKSKDVCAVECLYAYRQNAMYVDRYYQNVFRMPNGHYLAIVLQGALSSKGDYPSDRILVAEITEGHQWAAEYSFGALNEQFHPGSGSTYKISISERSANGVVSVTETQSGAGVAIPLYDLYSARYVNAFYTRHTDYQKLGDKTYNVVPEGGRTVASALFFSDKLDYGHADSLSLMPSYVVALDQRDHPIGNSGYFIRWRGTSWRVEK